MRPQLKTSTRELTPLDLADWLGAQNCGQKVYLRLRDHDWTAAGIGNVLESLSPEEARELAARPATDQHFYCAQNFFGGDFRVMLPRTEIVAEKGRYRMIVRAWDDEAPAFTRYAVSDQQTPPPAITLSATATGRRTFPDLDGWNDYHSKALGAFSGRLEKLVLGRLTEFSLNGETDAVKLLSAIDQELYLALYQWSEDASFLSASPERLFRVENGWLTTEALAGTRRRGKTTEQDEANAKDMRESPKDREEHRIVVDDILRKIRALGLTPEHGATGVVRMKQLMHLRTPIQAAAPRLTPFDFISSLHPTAALGGYPRAEALQWLKANEPFDRGFFGGPFGVITPQWSEFFVNIRSAVLEYRQLRVFSGVGVVPGSLAASEWDELEAKIQPYQAALS